MICWLKTYVWIQSASDAQAQRAILFFGQGNALSTACCGGKFRAQGFVEGALDDLLAENLCVAGFNPPVMHRHSALSCFVARAMPSVPPVVVGNSGPRGVLGKLRLFVD